MDKRPVHRRRSVRLKGYDYGQPGAYFVTIVTHGRKCMVGRVASGTTHLSRCGQIAEVCWRQIPEHFEQVELRSFVVMPNHIHGILVLHERADRPMRARRGVPLPAALEAFGQPVSGSLASMIRQYESSVTREFVRLSEGERSIWQRGYHDHVIRDKVEWSRIDCYIAEHPANWAQDPERHAEAVLEPTQP
jgi:putative transposase